MQVKIASRNCKLNLQVRFESKARQIMKLQWTKKQKLPFFLLFLTETNLWLSLRLVKKGIVVKGKEFSCSLVGPMLTSKCFERWYHTETVLFEEKASNYATEWFQEIMLALNWFLLEHGWHFYRPQGCCSVLFMEKSSVLWKIANQDFFGVPSSVTTSFSLPQSR